MHRHRWRHRPFLPFLPPDGGCWLSSSCWSAPPGGVMGRNAPVCRSQLSTMSKISLELCSNVRNLWDNQEQHQAQWFVSLLLPPANEVCEGYVFTGVCLFSGVGMFLSRGVSVQVGSMSGGVCRGDPHTVMCGQYASYWNAFFFLFCFLVFLSVEGS